MKAYLFLIIAILSCSNNLLSAQNDLIDILSKNPKTTTRIGLDSKSILLHEYNVTDPRNYFYGLKLWWFTIPKEWVTIKINPVRITGSNKYIFEQVSQGTENSSH